MQLSNPIEIYVPTVENAAHHWDKSFQKSTKLSVQTISKILKSKDFNSAVILLDNILKNNNPPSLKKEAHYLLGLLFLHGAPGITSNISEALDHLKVGTSAAKYTAGVIYLKGLYGVSQNSGLGLQYLGEASAEGSRKASFTIGAIEHQKKSGGLKAEAISQTAITRFVLDELLQKNKFKEKTILKIIGRSDLSAQPELYLKFGDLACHEWNRTGKLFAKTMMTEAWENAQKSGAKLKNDPQASAYTKEAHRKLGIVKYDYSWYQEAVKHWERAAEEPFPDPTAQYYLGLAYTSGKGVNKDIKKGKEYLQKASSQGFIQANAVLNHLENKQTLSIKQGGNIEEKNELGLPANAEKDVVQATKPFLNKVFSWFRKYSGPIIGAIAAITITTLAIGAIVGGLIALTISFPHIMVPVWKIVGEVGFVALYVIITLAKLVLHVVC